MFTLKRLALLLGMVTLLAAPGLAVQPPADPDAGVPVAAHGRDVLHKVVGNVEFRLELHSITAHHRDMTDKHNEVAGFTGSHVLMLQLLDKGTAQALTGLKPTVKIVGPAKQVVADAAALKWFVPQGRAPYYGLGLNLSKTGDYTVTVNFVRGKTPVTATFTVPVR